MCEFTVILDDEVIARRVIKAKIKDGTVIMADTAGEIIRVEGATIKNVDTIMAELILTKAAS